MTRIFAVSLVALGLLPGLFADSALAGGDALPDTIARVKPSIVAVGSVQFTRNPTDKFSGTGFVVADGNYVVTNAHVTPHDLDLEHKEFLAVFSPKGGHSRTVRRHRAKELAVDQRHDLSLLRIAGGPLPALDLGDSERVREGELYAFTGFPIGPVLGALYPVTHRGIVSALTPIALPVVSYRQLTKKMRRQLEEPFTVFQMDAVAYPGNSGSPVYSPTTGEVVAVVNAVFVKGTRENALEKPSGITYAIPARHVQALLRKAGVSGAPAPNPDPW